MLFIELKLAHHLVGPISGRTDLEDGLRRNVVFLPLLVRTSPPFRAVERDQRVGSGANSRISLDRVPKQVSGHENAGIMTVKCFEAFLDYNDPFELERVVRHELAVVVGIFDRWLNESLGRSRHDRTRPRGTT